jgi:subtilisin family serine protease
METIRMRHLSIWQRRLAAMLLLLSFAAPGLVAPISAAPPAGNPPDDVLVKLSPSANPHAFAAIHRLKQPQSVDDQLDDQPIYRLQIADGEAPADKAAELMDDPRVIYAEPNYVGELPEARQRSSWVVVDGIGGSATQWAPVALRLPEAHTITRGANVTVAILDTGADLSHPALAGHLVPGYDFVDLDVDVCEIGA